MGSGSPPRILGSPPSWCGWGPHGCATYLTSFCLACGCVAPFRYQSRGYGGPAAGMLLHSGCSPGAAAIGQLLHWCHSTWASTAVQRAPIPLPIQGLWGPCCWHAHRALRWARLWRALCGACVAHVWPASCVASCVGVHCTGSEDALRAGRVLAQHCPAVLALLLTMWEGRGG